MSSSENYVVSTSVQYKEKQNKITDRWFSNIPIILLEKVLLEHLEPYSYFTNNSEKVQFYLKTDPAIFVCLKLCTPFKAIRYNYKA